VVQVLYLPNNILVGLLLVPPTHWLQNYNST